MVTAWVILKSKLTGALHTVLVTVEDVLDLSHETLASCDELRWCLTTVEEGVVRAVEKRKTLKADLHDNKLKLELMDDSKRRATSAKPNVAAAPLQVVEVRNELDKVAEKRNKFEGKLREVASESRRQLIV